MEEKVFFDESMSDKEFLRLTRFKKPKPEMTKVKCLGWCDKEFMSPSKFVRFCDKCRSKKDKISEDNYIFQHGSCGVNVSGDE